MNTDNRKKIMIADDDPGIIDAMAILLEFHGYQVSTTSDGSSVLRLTDNFPDLLLLDIWMSGEDGREICKQLKSHKAMQLIPVILVSASRDIEKSALDAGADDFLAKPFDMYDLLQKVEFMLSKKPVK